MLLKEKINEIFMPSLKHRALVKITIALWNRSDITDLMTRSSTRFLLYDFIKRPKEWQAIQDTIMGKVPKLKLPEPLKKEVVNLIQPIGLEILKWKMIHEYESFPVLSTELCWTPQGTVDQKKTAEILIKNESLDITDRYNLACNYCLEEEVKELWNSFPQIKKDELYNRAPYFSGTLSLVVFWTYFLKGKLTEFSNLNKIIDEKEISPYQLEFEYSESFGNKAATEYFFKKLTPRERNESLIRITDKYDIFSNVKKAEILCFSLSQMNEEQQVKIFEKVSSVLPCLLEWPCQNVFMEAANCTWDFLSEGRYKYVLDVIVDKIMSGYTDWNYHELFGEFWQQSPNSFKKCECASMFLLLSNLFEIEDIGNIKIILRAATVKEREDIIFHKEGKRICQNLIYKNECGLLKFFVQECISSKDSMIKFKGEFKHIISHCSMRRTEGVKDLWTEFFEFLDELIHKDNK